MKFYEIEPKAGGGYYLLENGQPIARFDDLAKAEAARELFMLEVAKELATRQQQEGTQE